MIRWCFSRTICTEGRYLFLARVISTSIVVTPIMGSRKRNISLGLMILVQVQKEVAPLMPRVHSRKKGLPIYFWCNSWITGPGEVMKILAELQGIVQMMTAGPGQDV